MNNSMKRFAIVLSVLVSLLTFTGASAHPHADVRHDRITHIVSAQKYPQPGTPVIVEVYGNGGVKWSVQQVGKLEG